MNEYHKIKTVFLRDPETNYRTLLEGQYAIPEFEYLADNHWIWTEKIDGTNIRVIWEGSKPVAGDGFLFNGKSEKSQIPPYLLESLKEIFIPRKIDFESVFENTDVCLYGEGCGAKIQKGGGKYKSEGQTFVLFDIKIGHWWLKREDVEGIAHNLGLQIAPIIGGGPLVDMVEKIKHGFRSDWGEFTAEGIVARPAVELIDRSGRRIITKLKYKDFPR